MSAVSVPLATTDDGLRRPAQTDDRIYWITGLCMLYCRRDRVRVLRLGPVQVPGAIGELYGCGQCVGELDYMVYGQLHRTNCRREAGQR